MYNYKKGVFLKEKGIWIGFKFVILLFIEVDKFCILGLYMFISFC